MSIFEYDEEKHMRLLRAEGREEGRKEGIAEGQLCKMADLVTRKIRASGMNFEEACKDLMLNEAEINSVRAYVKKQNG